LAANDGGREERFPMSEGEQIEEQIRNVLAQETRAIPLSNALFQPDGLFSRLAGTEAERRLVAQSPLFRQAQERLSELQRQEAAEFGRVVRQAQTAQPEGGLWLHLEHPKKS
jgi:hypothetical protein